MELYNFFTKVTDDKEEIEEMRQCVAELKEVCNFVELIEFNSPFSIEPVSRFQIIGQIYGDDTNIGDTDLFRIFSNIKYTWFDAYMPSINNLK